jgi:hypothetical protein
MAHPRGTPEDLSSAPRELNGQDTDGSSDLRGDIRGYADLGYRLALAACLALAVDA